MRVIRIMDGQFIQGMQMSSDESRIESGQFTDENIDGPSIGHDVVQGHNHQIIEARRDLRLRFGELEQTNTDQRSFREIERAYRFLAS